METSLSRKSCEPCRGGIPPLDRATSERYLEKVPGWTLAADPDRIERRFAVKDFAAAQEIALRVGAVAEAEGHHPEIRYGWGYCVVAFWTHKINGLHENDFIMAAKVNDLAMPQT